MMVIIWQLGPIYDIVQRKRGSLDFFPTWGLQKTCYNANYYSIYRRFRDLLTGILLGQGQSISDP